MKTDAGAELCLCCCNVRTTTRTECCNAPVCGDCLAQWHGADDMAACMHCRRVVNPEGKSAVRVPLDFGFTRIADAPDRTLLGGYTNTTSMTMDPETGTPESFIRGGTTSTLPDGSRVATGAVSMRLGDSAEGDVVPRPPLFSSLGGTAFPSSPSMMWELLSVEPTTLEGGRTITTSRSSDDVRQRFAFVRDVAMRLGDPADADAADDTEGDVVPRQRARHRTAGDRERRRFESATPPTRFFQTGHRNRR